MPSVSSFDTVVTLTSRVTSETAHIEAKSSFRRRNVDNLIAKRSKKYPWFQFGIQVILLINFLEFNINSIEATTLFEFKSLRWTSQSDLHYGH